MEIVPARTSGSSGLSCSFRPGVADNSGHYTRAGRGHPVPSPLYFCGVGQNMAHTFSTSTKKGGSYVGVDGEMGKPLIPFYR